MKIKSLKLITIFVSVLIACIGVLSIRAQSTAKSVNTPESLVADLYRVHKARRGPFFQSRNRALLNKYFEKDLATLIWNDAVKSKGEVGVIDGDPLYDAQDMEIKNFMIHKARHEQSGELVDATFENLGEKKTITFVMVKSAGGWRIHDIVYAPDRTLRSEFKEGN